MAADIEAVKQIIAGVRTVRNQKNIAQKDKGNWNGLLTTDLSLSFLEAYRIYARRWATEVAYKDCKLKLPYNV